MSLVASALSVYLTSAVKTCLVWRCSEEAEAVPPFSGIILSQKGNVDCGGSLTLPLLISSFLFLGF